jgi:hypothetical protein
MNQMGGSMRKLILCSLLFTLSGPASAQGLSLSILGGVSKDSRSKTENLWKMGFSGAVQGFVSIPGLTIGGRVAVHFWGADGEGWLKELDPTPSHTLQSSSGSQTLIEIVPSARFGLLNPPVGPRLDLQLGAGIFLVNAGDVTISGAFDTGTSSGQTTWVLTQEKLTGFGPQVGLALGIGMFEINPVYTAYSAGGDWYNHWAVNAGVRLGI